ncbi:MAG TPA: FHA domain-containing protein [Anaerolineae bacterium]|nr:FHA domain-containing protein [Anaerolineae bacterium]
MSEQEVAMLILQGADQRWPLDKDRLTIGRGPDCDIILPDRVVSRRHACIERRNGDYFITDDHSKNGTFVNGEPVTDRPRQLIDGDEIQIALRFRLTFVDAGATAPLSLEEALPTPTPRPSSPGLHLDDTRRMVTVAGRTLEPPLSVAQYRLLRCLVEARGAVVSREEIVAAVWPESHGQGVSEQAIDALVRRLRERLAELDPDHQYIVTVRGHGFRLENP